MKENAMNNSELVFTVQIISEEIKNLLQGKIISAGIVWKITSKILLLMEEDPISEKIYQLCKLELQNAEVIMKEIEFEKDKKGALQRCLTHLELAFAIIKEHYQSELGRLKNMICQSFTNGMPWIYSKESQNIYNDMVKIAFYQMMCHKMLENKNDKLCSIIAQVPAITDYSFGVYTEIIKELLGEEQFEHILLNRRQAFIKDIRPWAEMIAKPHTSTMYDVSVKMTRSALKREHPISFHESAFVDFLREKLDRKTVIALIGDSYDDVGKFKIF